jgi:16S rRNA (adenine(1408)-N(1))-methyltransferase
MRIVTGKRIEECTGDQLRARIGLRNRLQIDLGTGDGKFVYRTAKQDPETFCIGVDPAAENLREISHKARRKPARGGLPNVLFVVASIESMPEELNGLADRVTVNYPWGSLLELFVTAAQSGLEAIARLGKPGAEVTVLLNASVFEDAAYMERLGLPEFDLSIAEKKLKPGMEKAGFESIMCEMLAGSPPNVSSWERRLTAGAGRKTLSVTATVSG